jgi:hypothetical protein
MPAEAVIQGMRMEMEKMYGQICALSAHLEDLRVRTALIIKKTEKGEKSFDYNFEGDFTALRNNMRLMNAKANDFYHFSERAMKMFRMAPSLQNSINMARSLFVVTRHFRLELEKLAAIQSAARPLFRKIPITIYWWELDKVVDELYKVSGLMLNLNKNILALAGGDLPPQDSTEESTEAPQP